MTAAAVTAVAIGARASLVVDSGRVDPGVTSDDVASKPSTPTMIRPAPVAMPSRSVATHPATSIPEASTRSVLAIPEHGSGNFTIAGGSSDPTGTGHLVTYTVEVEDGLPYGAGRVAHAVDAILADARGWTTPMSVSLQRVSLSASLPPSFRIRLASPQTTDALCAPLDTGGRLSCRNGSMVVLNAWRWAYGTDTYGGDLTNYRVYMVNHEFGHALGNGHATCPGEGEPAPVMVQQTKGLGGCSANPWPTAD